jgi:hypothetical protein
MRSGVAEKKTFLNPWSSAFKRPQSHKRGSFRSSTQLSAVSVSATHGRGAAVGCGLGVGAHLPMHGVGVGVDVGVEAGVGEGPSRAQYLPPVFK